MFMMDTSLHFTSTNHPTHLLTKMNMLRRDGQLCDATIITSSKQRIGAHRVVLAACSPYFAPLLEPAHTPSFSRLPLEIHVPEMDADCIEQIIEFCYTSSISVTEENVWTLLPTAARLQMGELRNLCCDFLQSMLSPDASMQTYMVALRSGLTELAGQAQKIIKEHLDEVLQSEGFLEMTVTDMTEVLHNLPSSVLGHRDSVKAIRHWVTYHKDARQRYAPQLGHSFPGLLSRLKEFLPEDLLLQPMEVDSLSASPSPAHTPTTTPGLSSADVTPRLSPADAATPYLSPSRTTHALSPASFHQVLPLALDIKAHLSPVDARSRQDITDSDSELKGLDLSMSSSLLREREDAASDSIPSDSASGDSPVTSSPLCQVCGELFHTSPQLRHHQEDCANLLYREGGEILENGFPSSPAEQPDSGDGENGVVRRGDQQACQLCSKLFPDRKSLGKHMRTHSQVGFQCTSCNKRYSTRSDLQGHMRLHTAGAGTHAPLACEYCQRPFSSYCALKVHMRGHKGTRPFSCPQCRQHFAKNIHLKRHLSTHTGIKPHECGFCGKHFSRSDHLKRHEQSIHKGQRPHSCDICGKAFVRKYELSKHISQLHGPRPSTPSTILPEAHWDSCAFYGISAPGLGLPVPESLIPSERVDQR